MWRRACTIGLFLSCLVLLLYNEAIKTIPSPLNPDQAHKARLGIVPAHNYSSNAHDHGTDIIFVHGLGSNPDTTWQARKPAESKNAPEEYVNWVTEFLPGDLPTSDDHDTRIFFYNFDSFWKRDSLQVRLSTIGNDLLEHISNTIRQSERDQARDLIFVGYSYGGLVIKQALVSAHGRQGSDDIFQHTKAILFLGTPHRGSAFSTWGRWTARALQLIGSNPAILGEVEYDSTRLLDLHTSFQEIVSDKLHIVNFFEQRPTVLFTFGFIRWRELCVREQSAKYAGGKVRNIGLPVDHKGLNKFRSRDTNYQLILSILNQSLNFKPLATPAPIENETGEFHIPLELPVLRNERFVGRSLLLQQISHYLDQGCLDLQKCIVAIHGPGGIGKTQVAVEYAYDYQAKYSAVFWIDASTEHTIQRSFSLAAERILRNFRTHSRNESIYQEFAQRFQPEDSTNIKSQNSSKALQAAKGVMSWLEEATNDKWLLIFDNADELEAFDIRAYMPKSRYGNLFITTRRKDVSGYWTSIEVEQMSHDEGKALLAKSSGFDGQCDEATVLELLSILGNFPLAIEQAGAYISVQKSNLPQDSDMYTRALQNYISEYRSNAERLLGHRRPQSVWDYRNDTILTTWEVSLRKIEEDTPEASELLHLCGFLSNNDLFEELFAYNPRFQNHNIPIRSLMHILSSYSLVSFSASMDAISLHPLVHYWTQQRLALDRKRQLSAESIRFLTRALRIKEKGAPLQQYNTFEFRISPHVHAALRNAEKFLSKAPPLVAEDRLYPPVEMTLPPVLSILYDITEGWLLWLAHNIHQMWLFTLSFSYEPEDLESEIWWLSYKLTIVIRSHAPATSIERLFSWELSEAYQRLQPKSPRALYIAGDLAWVLFRMNFRMQEAKMWYEWILTSRRKVLGRRHYATLGALMGIADIAEAEGDLDRALELMMIAYKEREAQWGKHHMYTLNAAEGVGYIYLHQAQHRYADQWFQKIFLARASTYGQDSEQALRAAQKYIRAFTRYDTADISLRWHQRSLEILNRTHGPDHSTVLEQLLSIGYMLCDYNACVGAQEWALMAMSRYARLLGPTDEHTISANYFIQHICHTLGNGSEAVECGKVQLQANNEIFGSESLHTLVSMHDLVIYLSDMGDYSAALQLGQSTLQKMSTTLGPHHQNTLLMAYCLAYKYKESGDNVTSVQMFELTFKGRNTTLGLAHIETYHIAHNLARHHAMEGNHSAAIMWDELALQGRDESLGPYHQETLESLYSLALDFQNLEDDYSAIEFLKILLERSNTAFGADNPHALDTLNQIGLAYERLGDYETSIQCGHSVVQGRNATLGPEHEATLEAVHTLARHYLTLEDVASAITFFTIVFQGRNATLGANHADTLYIIDQLVHAYSRLGDHSMAIEWAQLTLQGWNDTLGPEHELTLHAMQDLGFDYGILGDHAAARKWNELAAQGRIVTLGLEHEDTIGSLYNMATNLVRLGQCDEALKWLKQSLDVLLKVMGRDHHFTRYTIENIKFCIGEIRRGETRKTGEMRTMGDR